MPDSMLIVESDERGVVTYTATRDSVSTMMLSVVGKGLSLSATMVLTTRALTARR